MHLLTSDQIKDLMYKTKNALIDHCSEKWIPVFISICKYADIEAIQEHFIPVVMGLGDYAQPVSARIIASRLTGAIAKAMGN